MSEPAQVKADIIGYTDEYASIVRSWIDSEETIHNLTRQREFPPPDDIVSQWQKPNMSAYLLFSENKPVAYGELWNRPQEMAVEIDHLLVDPAKRYRGYGSKMLSLLYDRAAQRPSVSQVFLNLRTGSEEALGCYIKAGFEIVGTTSGGIALKMIRLVR